MFGLSTMELLALIGAIYPVVLLVPESLAKITQWLSATNFQGIVFASWVGNIFIGGFGLFALGLFSQLQSASTGTTLISTDFAGTYGMIFGLYWFDLNVTLTYGGLKAKKLEWPF